MKLHKVIYLLLSSAYLFLSSMHASIAPNTWDVLRDQFHLNHEVEQPEVQAQLRWFTSHPGYLQKLAHSEPYMYHIISEIKKRHLPGELALLPMIESAFNPFAYSGAGAAGLWQFMPGTGSNWGLKQDWWFDGRRSIRPSTDAALNYLTYLNKYFNGNWLFAIAAYDCGEGAVSRAITNSGQSSLNVRFWSLPVPAETKAYVPRLLALAEIIKYPERYHITLPDIPHMPYFEEVNIGSQIDLNHAAKLAGISYKALIKLNPGYNRWATAPYKPFKLLIPSDKVAYFNRNLSHVPRDKRVSWIKHRVRHGDTLNSIAQQYYTSTTLLREVNQLKTDMLKNNQSILIPSTKNAPVVSSKPPPIQISDRLASSETYRVIHIVQVNETLKTLEIKYSVTAEKILIWNKLNATKKLTPGQQLIIWRNRVTPGIYTVVEGDSLTGIAKRYKTSVLSLKKLNPELTTQVLQPGQRLFIG